MTIENTQELRAYLTKRMEKLVSGDESVATARAAASLATQVNTSLALDMAAQKLAEQLGCDNPPKSLKC